MVVLVVVLIVCTKLEKKIEKAKRIKENYLKIYYCLHFGGIASMGIDGSRPAGKEGMAISEKGQWNYIPLPLNYLSKLFIILSDY